MAQIWISQQLEQQLCALSAQLGVPVYLVGGYVRGSLLGLPPADVDIASFRALHQEFTSTFEGGRPDEN